ncbi:Mos [Sergentomyia squamirostris]
MNLIQKFFLVKIKNKSSRKRFLSPNVHKANGDQCVDTPDRLNFLQKNCSDAGAKKVNILGRGAYGIVLKATYRGHRVAVKVVQLLRRHCIRSLMSEGNILDWKHPNIILIHKIVTDTSHGLVIMERITGDNLQVILNSVKMGSSSAVEILMQMVSALAFCHQQGIIHGDVKPLNILINLEGKGKFVAKLGDFGSSINLNRSSQNIDYQGTIRYMSPEALQAAPPTVKIDIFSLGITMWQMESRKIPYSELSSNEIIAYRVIREGLRPDAVPENPQIPRILLDEKSLSGTIPSAISSRRIHSESLLMKNLGNFEGENLPRSLNILLKEAQIENHQEVTLRKIPWKRIFKEDKWIESEKYRKLYKQCWHEDPSQRPETTTLLQDLQKLQK